MAGRGGTFEKLSVKLEADINGLVAGLNKGRAETDKVAFQMQGSLAGVGRAFDKVTSATNFFRAGLATLAGSALVQAARSGIEFADSIGEVAQQAGVGTDFLQKFQFAALQLDLTTQQADSSLIKFNKEIGDAIIQGGEAAKKFKDLGVELYDTQGAFRGNEAIFRDVVDSLGKVNTTAELSARAFEFFGKEAGTKFVALIQAGTAGLDQMGQQAAETGAVLDASIIKKGDEANKALGVLSQQIDANLATAFVNLVPVIDLASAALTRWNKDGQLTSDLVNFAIGGPGLAYLLRDAGDEANASEPELRKFNDELGKTIGFIDDLSRAPMPELPRPDYVTQPGAIPKTEEEKKSETRAQEAADKAARSAREKSAKEMQDWQEGLLEYKKKWLEDGMQLQADDLNAQIEFDEQRIQQALATSEALRDVADGVNRAMQNNANREIGDFFGGSDTVSADDAINAINERAALETEAEITNYIIRDEALRELKDLSVEDEANRQMLLQDMEQLHQDELTRINEEAAEARIRVKQLENDLLLSGAQQVFGDLSVLMNSKSRALFEIGKSAAIASTVISTIKSAQDSYSSLASIPYVGPILGGIAAAAAITAGVARVQAISSTQFGSRNVPAGAGGGGASAAGASGAGAAAPQGQRAIINLQGDDDTRYSPRQVRQLLEQLNLARGDGAGDDFVITGAGQF